MKIEAYEQLSGALVVDIYGTVSIKIQSSDGAGQWYELEPVSSNLIWLSDDIDKAALDVALVEFKGGV